MTANTAHLYLNQPYFHALPPLSLYIHLPWCIKKCPYCDFNSHEAKFTQTDSFPEKRYIEALIADLEQMLPLFWGRSIQSIFIGGGTPSLFSPESIDSLMCALRARLRFDSYTEVTLEANPSTVEQAKFAEFSQAGINRISLGIQSFNDKHLKLLGRIHDSQQAQYAIEIAQKYFEHINLDLMFGLPKQTLKEAQHDIDQALSYHTGHLSCYQLTIEPQTKFFVEPPILPEEDLIYTIQECWQERLAAAGFEHYEVSAYAQKYQRCVHNVNYWLFGDYIGIGAGAHSKISFSHQIIRQARIRQPEVYMQKLLQPHTETDRKTVIAEERTIIRNEIGLEFMMNALRLTEGFHPNLFQERTGYPIHLVQSTLEHAQSLGFLEYTAAFIKPTQKGMHYLNNLLELFIIN